MGKRKNFPLNPVESKDVKAAVFELSEVAAKQLLYGMIQVLSLSSCIVKEQFLEILDDARKYGAILKNKS